VSRIGKTVMKKAVSFAPFIRKKIKKRVFDVWNAFLMYGAKD
jgi:hypothetical protein